MWVGGSGTSSNANTALARAELVNYCNLSDSEPITYLGVVKIEPSASS